MLTTNTEKIVEIEPTESEQVELLFAQFNGYVAILNYLFNNGTDGDNPVLKAKWDECLKISVELEKLKEQLDIKYRPIDGTNYTTFEFDFYHHQMIYRA